MPKNTWKASRHTKRTTKHAEKRRATKAEHRHTETPRNSRIPMGKQESKTANGLRVITNRLNRMSLGRVA